MDEKKFLDFVASVLEVSPASISMDMAQSDIPEWDSMAHLRLIMEIQSEYGVMIPLVEFTEIKTVRNLYAKVAERK